ncbi:MAG: cytochrome c biogenesis protein DipZ, partial [Omnitrophica WOR_2 bacterium]
MVILLFFAALSGLITVLSPCILPVLPIVLSSTLTGGKRRPLGVIAGLIISFSLFTLLIARIVALIGLSANTLRLIAVVVIGLLGMALVLPFLNTRIEALLSRLPGLIHQKETQGSGFGSGFLVGASLGLIWAPCAGPILAAVTALAATQTVTLGAGLVIIAYALGAGIPLLAIAYGGRSLIRRVPFLVQNTQRLQRLFGAVMVLTAALIAFNADTLVTAWATSLVPSGWSAQLNGFESSSLVNQQISRLRQAAPTPTAILPSTGQNAWVPDAVPSSLPDQGSAPDFAGIDHWINSPPLTMQSLRGKVVLVDFWTYSCINCIRTLPYITSWYSKYKDQGFVVVGVHSPEFAFEHDTKNVEQAVRRFNISYPVAQDNNYQTWQAFQNEYWPAEYLIDANGHLRRSHFGEGNYDQTEQDIQALLAEAGHPANKSLTQGSAVPFSDMQTPETYIGTDRQQNFASPEAVASGVEASYSLPKALPWNNFAVAGAWNFQPEYAQAAGARTQIELHFAASDVYLVMSSDRPVQASVKLVSPGKPNHTEDI